MSEAPRVRAERRDVGGRAVIAIEGSLTWGALKPLEDALASLLAQPRCDVILDLSHVPLMDSRALEVLLDLHESLERKGGALRLSGLNEVCNDIMVATRLLNVLHVYEDVNRALRAGGGA